MASPPFQVTVKADKVIVRYDELPDDVRSKVLETVRALDRELLTLVRQKAGGGVVKVRTGKFLKSFRGSVRQTKSKISGSVRSSAPQAAIFEWGGTIPAHLILPNTAQALAFMMNAQQVFAKAVQHPATYIEQRSILHASLDEMHATITSEISGTVRDATNAGA